MAVVSIAEHVSHPTSTQLGWLRRGLDQPGGKLPLFDEWGQRVSEQTVRSCIAHGWALVRQSAEARMARLQANAGRAFPRRPPLTS